MSCSLRLRRGLSVILTVAAIAVACGGLMSCSTAPQPFLVSGPGQTGNEPPTLTFTEPLANLTRGQGDRFVIRWTDTDRDSNAQISFNLIDTADNEKIALVQGLDENDLIGPDSFSVSTALLPTGSYYLEGVISDGVNSDVSVFATVLDAAADRVTITITPEGAAPPTVPPVVAVIEPAFNLSVAQDDTLRVVIQPTNDVVSTKPYDPDSEVTLYVLLDTDLDPNNDDPANPTEFEPGELPTDIILLQTTTIEAEATNPNVFDIVIDLTDVPAQPNGDPYYVRATVDDLNNPRVHQYAKGTINVVELADGTVDLAEIGKTKSGARFYGFTPGANLGSKTSGVSDFDNDGVADFVMAAQYGNSRNYGLIGEAYLVYGTLQSRFGGAIAANSVSEDVAGVIFEAPPVRDGVMGVAGGYTLGITDVNWIPDITADGRPEIMFGLSHVHGANEAMDFDPGDDAGEADDDGEQVVLTIRQGPVTVEDNAGERMIDFNYRKVEDLTIRTDSPTTQNGSGNLSWLNDGTDQAWTLIKFSDILGLFPDPASNIQVPDVTATVTFRVYNTGGSANVFQAYTDFTESTTFSDFARNGGAPEAGVDYYDFGSNQGLGTLDAGEAGLVQVDISDLIRQLLDQELVAYSNEIRLLIAPPADPDEGADTAGARSSEFSVNTDERPTLQITYNRRSQVSSRGCYPDQLTNNQSTTPPDPDQYWFGGGMAIVFNSQNRDNDNVFGVFDPTTGDNPLGIDPRRLDETVVSIELIGQPNIRLDRNGTNYLQPEIFGRCDNSLADFIGNDPREAQRIAGARFVGGWFDSVDASLLNQEPREGRFGQDVGYVGDLNNDGLSELVFSAPANERYLADVQEAFGAASTHLASTGFFGSIVVVPGANYNTGIGRETGQVGDGAGASVVIPTIDHYRFPGAGFGSCVTPIDDREGPIVPADTLEIFAEDIDDWLGDGQSAGDFNQDGLDDILCGAPLNDRSASRPDTGCTYILYGSNVVSDFRLANADDPLLRTPMLRIRGSRSGDQIGTRQSSALDVNGDRIDDIFVASPYADFGNITRPSCGEDINGDGRISALDFSMADFNACYTGENVHVFSDDPCIDYDLDYDRDVDLDDQAVFSCLANSNGSSSCCANLVQNGFVGIIFGGEFLDGDRELNQIGTPDLPGCRFYGSGAGDLAGWDISSAGDFNQDGFGDILITAPGKEFVDDNNRTRLGVVYLIFGSTKLYNKEFNLSEVGTDDLPGIVFYSPYVTGRPNEAAPETVSFLGDINGDGFGDICIGNPKADFIDLTYPQGPDAPGDDPSVGRRSDAGDAYIIYGNNFGSNRSIP